MTAAMVQHMAHIPRQSMPADAECALQNQAEIVDLNLKSPEAMQKHEQQPIRLQKHCMVNHEATCMQQPRTLN